MSDTYTYVHFPAGLGYTHAPANGEYTLRLEDAFELVRYETSGAGCSVIVPANAAVPFDIGTKVWVEVNTSGSVQIRGAPGVTLSRQVTLRGSNQQACVEKLAATSWRVGGLGV